MRMRSDAGVTLIEITIVLMALSILTAAMTPLATGTINRARLTRAVTDEEAIRTALNNFISDLPGYAGPHADGTSPGSAAIQMLVSDGDIPRDVSATGSTTWQDTVANGARVVDFIENHLVQNQPFADVTKLYPTSGGNAWRGTYLTAPVDSDPWGNRYAVNVQYLLGVAANRVNDVFVYSSGPDEQIDTAFQVNGIVPSDDDIIVVVRRDSGLTVP
jgi:type II secretory pathway pseudopilin PulG